MEGVTHNQEKTMRQTWGYSNQNFTKISFKPPNMFKLKILLYKLYPIKLSIKKVWDPLQGTRVLGREVTNARNRTVKPRKWLKTVEACQKGRVCGHAHSSHFSRVQPFVTLRATAHCSWDFCDKNTEVGFHALLQGIFLTQGSNPRLLCLLHCRQILYCWPSQEAPLKGLLLAKSGTRVIKKNNEYQWF